MHTNPEAQLGPGGWHTEAPGTYLGLSVTFPGRDLSGLLKKEMQSQGQAGRAGLPRPHPPALGNSPSKESPPQTHPNPALQTPAHEAGGLLHPASTLRNLDDVTFPS